MKKWKKKKNKPPKPKAIQLVIGVDSTAIRSAPVETQTNTPTIAQPRRAAARGRSGQGFWPGWLKGWKLLVEIGGLVGLLIAVYALRPVLSATLFDTNDGNTGAQVSVTDNGMSILGVSTQCITNKVIFSNRFTLELDNYALVNAYSVPHVRSGESFAVTCVFGWSMWMKSSDGFFALGDVQPGVQTLGIGFYVNNGVPALMRTGGAPQAVVSDLVGYSNYPVTAIDGSLLVRYHRPFSWFQQDKIIHVIACNQGGEKIRWRIAPESEPVIPDVDPRLLMAAGIKTTGFKVTARVRQMGGVLE